MVGFAQEDLSNFIKTSVKIIHKKKIMIKKHNNKISGS